MNPSILIVDDERDFRFSLSGFFKREGYTIYEAGSGKEALAEIKNTNPDLVLLDQILPDMNGTDLLKKIKESDLDCSVILMTAHGDIKTAVQAIRQGAADFLSKPFGNDEISLVVQKGLRSQELKQESSALREHILKSSKAVKIIGQSWKIKDLMKEVHKIAPTELTVVLQGESGTGKEVFARAIHQFSKRKNQIFIAVDCGTIPEQLVESELFGYEKGAFTGADRRKLGIFELADHGTIFLDEISNIPTSVQSKLLRVIQERKIQHLGGKREIPVNVRVIVATNTPLEKAIRSGSFRSDLFYRLNQYSMTLPPLRERKDDVPPLVKECIREANLEFKKSVRGVESEVQNILKEYPWPGNVRQLKNVIRRAVLLADSEISAEHLPYEVSGDRRQTDRRKHSMMNGSLPEIRRGKNMRLKPVIDNITRRIEKEMILKALEKTMNNRLKAASLLGIDRTSLYYKLRLHKIK